jgi:hypothetical protein
VRRPNNTTKANFLPHHFGESIDNDTWLWREAQWNDVIANNYWMWYHVYEDEINHRGETRWRLSRMPAVV